MKESVAVPVVANGDIRSEEDVERVKKETGVDGKLTSSTDLGLNNYFKVLCRQEGY